MCSSSGYPAPIEDWNMEVQRRRGCWASGAPVAVQVLGQWRSTNAAVKVLGKKKQCCQPVMTVAETVRLINIPKDISLLQVIESETRL